MAEPVVCEQTCSYTVLNMAAPPPPPPHILTWNECGKVQAAQESIARSRAVKLHGSAVPTDSHSVVDEMYGTHIMSSCVRAHET